MHCTGGDEYGGHWQHDINGITIEPKFGSCGSENGASTQNHRGL